jgi:hypothetical protein
MQEQGYKLFPINPQRHLLVQFRWLVAVLENNDPCSMRNDEKENIKQTPAYLLWLFRGLVTCKNMIVA